MSKVAGFAFTQHSPQPLSPPTPQLHRRPDNNHLEGMALVFMALTMPTTIVVFHFACTVCVTGSWMRIPRKALHTHTADPSTNALIYFKHLPVTLKGQNTFEVWSGQERIDKQLRERENKADRLLSFVFAAKIPESWTIWTHTQKVK